MSIYRVLSRHLILLPAVVLLACSGTGNDKGSAAAPVHVAAVERASVPRAVRAVGNVAASARVSVVPRVAGEIIGVNFSEGSNVKAGDELIRIDPRPYEAALREKRGQLAKSEAQLAKALEDRARYGKLAGQGYVSREAYQQTATDAAALRATVMSDKAAVEAAALDLAYCTVKAPISGRAGPLNMDAGNMIKANSADPVVEIETISPCYVHFSVPEVYLPQILQLFDQGPLPVSVRPPSGKNEDGFLTLIDNNVDTKTGAIRLRASFKNEPRRLWPGQFVEVELPLGLEENALILPAKAVLSGREGQYVYVVDEESRARMRPVRVLFEHGDRSVLAGGLESGDRVVLDGHVRLADGVPVHVVE